MDCQIRKGQISIYLVFVFIASILSVSCIKRFEKHKVSGVLYNTDEVSPVAGADLVLVGYNNFNFNNYETELATATTDEDGYFEFSYRTDSKAALTDIQTASGKTLLANMGANESYYRDVCLKAVGYVHFDFLFEPSLRENDTIFIEITDKEPITSYQKGVVNVIVHPFEELKLFEKVSLNWSRVPGDLRSCRWGFGWQDFKVNGGENIGDDGYYINSERFDLSGFPEVDTVEIAL